MSVDGQELQPREVETVAPAPEPQGGDDSVPARARPAREQATRRYVRWLAVALALAGVLAFVVVPLAVIVPRLGQRPTPQARVTPTPQATPTVTPAPLAAFGESFISFRYPPEWWVMGPAEARAALVTALRGMAANEYSYAGGVYTEGLDNCQACAQILVVVLRDPKWSGALSEADYQNLLLASEREMGARLLRHKQVQVSSMPAVESIYLSADGKARVWQLLVVPPEAGAAYLVRCSSQADSFATFEPVFRQALDTLRIPGPVPTVVPTPVRTPTRRPTATRAITYTVKSGDVLGQIAKDLGVSLEALAEVNGLTDPYILQPGQVLTVPMGSR